MIAERKMEIQEIRDMDPCFFEDMVKIVIDRKLHKLALQAEMHSDLQIELYDSGSNEKDLYGANIYWDGSIEWTSTINVARNRELQGGVYGREIKDPDVIAELTDIVNEWVYR